MASLGSRGRCVAVTSRSESLAEGDYAAVSRNPEVIQAYMGQGHA